MKLLQFVKHIPTFEVIPKRLLTTIHHGYKEPFIVTLIGADTPVGRIASLLLKQNQQIHELRLHCSCNCDYVCGNAVDISHIDSTACLKAYLGSNMLRDAITGAKVIIVVGHSQRNPNEKEEEMFARNSPHVRNAAIFASEFARDAIFCVGCQPINALVPMVSEEFKKAREYDPKKIIGITNLFTIRLKSILGCYTGQDACKVSCPVIGGACQYSAVAILSQAKPCGDFHKDLCEKIQRKLSRAEDDVLELKAQERNNDGCALSQAFAISRFVTHLTQGMLGCKQYTEYAFVRQTGHIENFLPYMTSVVKLGKSIVPVIFGDDTYVKIKDHINDVLTKRRPNGVEATHMPKINDYECSLLQNAAITIENSIQVGSSYVTGEKARKPKIDPKIAITCEPVKQENTSYAIEDLKDFNPLQGKLCPSEEAKLKHKNQESCG